jgi:hypothetical protein
MGFPEGIEGSLSVNKGSADADFGHEIDVIWTWYGLVMVGAEKPPTHIDVSAND